MLSLWKVDCQKLFVYKLSNELSDVKTIIKKNRIRDAREDFAMATDNTSWRSTSTQKTPTHQTHTLDIEISDNGCKRTTTHEHTHDTYIPTPTRRRHIRQQQPPHTGPTHNIPTADAHRHIRQRNTGRQHHTPTHQTQTYQTPKHWVYRPDTDKLGR